MINRDYKYNYVILTSDASYYLPFFNGLDNLENIIVRQEGYTGRFRSPSHLRLVSEVRAENGYLKNLRAKTRLASEFKCIYDDFRFPNSNPICFVFCEPFYILEENGFLEYIYKRNPQNKTVVCLMDLYQNKLPGTPSIRNALPDKRSVDLVTSYFKEDANKYGFAYFKEKVYSPPFDAVTEDADFDYDLFFLGRAKERLPFLLDLYDYLSQKGIRCSFNIIEAPDGIKRANSGLNYIDHVSYEKNIQMMQRSRCILEVAQAGAQVHTLRTGEAVGYRRKLLTTNLSLESDKAIYNPVQMHAFESKEEINLDFLRSDNDYKNFSDPLEWSPISRINFLEEYFSSYKT
jgi:hypothetical protein